MVQDKESINSKINTLYAFTLCNLGCYYDFNIISHTQRLVGQMPRYNKIFSWRDSVFNQSIV